MAIELSRLCVPFTPLSRPLEDCRVALVSTAGVFAAGQEPFDPENDTSIRVIASDVPTEALRVSHGHYDHGDADRDPNVVFPLDRLRELAKAGEIKELAPGAVSMGFTQSFRVVRDETTPQIVEEVNRWSVDVCVLTAGWPLCHRTVVTIQRAIEMTGVSTVLVTVDPEQSRAARPPRALCPEGFPIGQSLGRPGDARTQTRVLRDALRLLVRYPEEPGTIVTRDYR